MDPSKTESVVFQIAAKDIGRLIERGGKTVRKIRQNTSCKVRHCMKNFVKVCLNFGKQRGRTRLI